MSNPRKQSFTNRERPTKCRATEGSPDQPDAAAFRDWTVFDLKVRVKELGIEGFSDKSRDELIQMLEAGISTR